MAELNGQKVNFNNKNGHEIGEQLLEASPTGDGKGINLQLTESEQEIFEAIAEMRVGLYFASAIADAVEKKTGTKPTDLRYTYGNQVFSTQ